MLTLKEKIYCLQKALDEYELDLTDGEETQNYNHLPICVLLSNLSYLLFSHIDEDQFEFSELFDYKPKSSRKNGVWFSIDKEGLLKRIEIVKKLINRYETELSDNQQITTS